MMSPNTPAPEDAATPKQSHLTYPDLRARFPQILDIHSDEKGWFNPDGTRVGGWFRTESTDLVAFPAVVQAVGRAYFVKNKQPISLGDVKIHLRKHLNGSADQPIRLNQLSKIVAGTVRALTKTRRKKKQIPSLKFVDLRVRFPDLIVTDAKKNKRLRKKAVSRWLASTSEELVDPAALVTLTTRVFFLKYNKIINPSYINAYLRQTGTTEPVPLKDLSSIVAKAVATLVKGPTEKPERKPDYVAPEKPVLHTPSIFNPNTDAVVRDMDSAINKKNAQYIIDAACGLITPLKGTTGVKWKWTEKQICERVFTKMQWQYEVGDDMLRAFIAAAWDRLGGSGSGYEGNKGRMGSSSNKPINLPARKG